MGNCQAVDAAALVIQHPSGKVERMYWPIKANEVMKMNPGHYVFLIIPLPMSDSERVAATAASAPSDQKKAVRYTRVKLLRPTDTLILGHAYRLVTSQEVKKVLKAKKLGKTKLNEIGLGTDKLQMNQEGEKLESERNDEESKRERQRLRTGSMNSRSKTWRPSLNSISEAAS